MDICFSDRLRDEINNLISVKREEQEYFNSIGDSKSMNNINFKIRSYVKWISLIKEFENIFNPSKNPFPGFNLYYSYVDDNKI